MVEELTRTREDFPSNSLDYHWETGPHRGSWEEKTDVKEKGRSVVIFLLGRCRPTSGLEDLFNFLIKMWQDISSRKWRPPRKGKEIYRLGELPRFPKEEKGIRGSGTSSEANPRSILKLQEI